MSTLYAFFASASEDVSLLSGEYLPELLLVTLLVLVMWTTKWFLTRDRGASR